jgi:glycosyltransferase involved in cell wall biosynthesis
VRPDGRLRVLTVVDSLRRGGAERLIVTTHAFLDRARYEGVVAVLRPPYELEPELRALGVRVARLDGAGPRDLARATLRLRRVMKAFCPDLIHTHLFSANIAGRLASGGRPVVTTLHNPDYGAENTATPTFRIRRLLDRATGHRYNRAFVAVSEAVRDDFAREMGFSPIEVVPNYIDQTAFTRRLQELDRRRERTLLGFGPDDIVALHVGRFHRQKAQDVLLRACQEAVRELPALRLVLAGDGPTLAEARALAEGLGLQDHVLFTGAVADPTPLYVASDLFAFPSRWEAFGIAMLEAMAAGLPVIATRTGGIPEVLGEDWPDLVEPDRVTELALALVRLARDPALRRARGEVARTRAARFDAPSGVQRLCEIYDRI